MTTMDWEDSSAEDTRTAPVTAAIRVLGTPELLMNILCHLNVVEVFKFQRVNKAFNRIFRIFPHLLRTEGVQQRLLGGTPVDHVETFAPFVNGLKRNELLIRPYEFCGVTAEPGSNKQTLNFFLHLSMQEYARDLGTKMGRAGHFGKTYDMWHSWGKVAIATSSFNVTITVQVPSGGICHILHNVAPGVTMMRDLFMNLEISRLAYPAYHSRALQEQQEQAESEDNEGIAKPSYNVVENMLRISRDAGEAGFRQIALGAQHLHFRCVDATSRSKLLG